MRRIGNKRNRRKWVAVCLVFCLLFSFLPGWTTEKAEAAGEALEVYFNGTRIGNTKYGATNAFQNFIVATPGFRNLGHYNTSIANGDLIPAGDNSTSYEMEIKVAENPALKALAQSGHAQVTFGWNKLDYDEFDCFFDWCKTRVTSASIKVDGQELSGSSHGGDTWYREKTADLSPNSTITVNVWAEGRGAGAYGVFIKFKDEKSPTLTSYTFKGNGAERFNNIINQKELYAKQNEYIRLAYNFDEPVKPTALTPSFSEHFLKHPLFVNPAGTGLPAAGQQQYLTNTTYNSGNLGELHNSIVYQYTASKYHHSGNLPLEPKIAGTTSGMAPIDQTLEEKFRGAVLTDAAGNIAQIQFPNIASGSSNGYLVGKTIDPFKYQNQGYRVIVDAVPPKYTKAGNGVQPELLTGVTVNNEDSIDFTVQLTEEATVKTGWDYEHTYLLFNNGMKAYYVNGENSATWTFRAPITEGVNLETALLKVIALTHDNKDSGVYDSDTNVIQDYAGNMLIQPANYDGVFTNPDGQDAANVNSKIDWAKLSIDNTKPLISYYYENGGASSTRWQKNGKVTIDANDPALLVPALEPDPTEVAKAQRPSKGIYRPSNMTGSASPAVGLVYYVWSSKPENPFASKSGDHFAAIKRYSLSAKQPREDLYPGEFGDLNLKVVNNKTNMIAPPAEALTDSGSGEWYLHTWTADMSWDSARELMQYEKMKTYIEDHPAQYAAWKAEITGSEADKTFYANNQALAAVGQYGDTAIWPLDNFTRNDSNWTYNVATIKLDNRAPSVSEDEVSGNDTAEVKVTTKVSDAHSGVKNVFFQWVKDGNELQEIDWKQAAPAGNQVSLTTMGNVLEDGAYRLYIKAADHAGNETVANVLEQPAIVNSASLVTGVFETEANPGYVQSHDVVFHVTGLQDGSVTTVTYGTYGVQVGYAYHSTSHRPDGDTFQPFSAFAYNPDDGALSYRIPANPTLNGIQYLHIKGNAQDSDRVYYFSKAYKFDNLLPEITFSKDGVAYPLPKHEVLVTVEDQPKSDDHPVRKQQYQWIKEGDAAPGVSSVNWVSLPSDGKVAIDNTSLEPGQTADYRLYVLAEDGAGNIAVTATTGIFKVSKAVEDNTPPAEAASDLIYLYGTPADGYTAIVKLSLDTEDKAGYDYSVSPDNGTSWVKWRPFTNFVSVQVPSGKAEDLRIQVKFRTPGGAVGDPVTLNTGSVQKNEPVYALASLSTTRPVNRNTGVDISVATPLGIKVVAAEANPSVPVRSGNQFHVNENGTYTFNLTDAADTTRTDTLYIVVHNIDTTKPEGSIEYLGTAKTNGNVTVKLENSEPVRIINNDGRAKYTFTQNGSFTFEFMDEAGNVGTATATVDYIDKEGPKVKVARSYSYGEDNREFGTIRDGSGNVLYSSGVTLEVIKENDGAKDFTVLDGQKTITVTENGTYSFVVADGFGNTTLVKEEVDNILSGLPTPEIAYTYVDDAGNPSDIVTIDGQEYARGKVKATLTGQIDSPNAIFSGVTPIQVNGQFTNQISDEDGAYTYSRIFSAGGTTRIALSDAVGNTYKIPITIRGLDNKAPEIALNLPAVSVEANKADFDFHTDLGGYILSDNVSKPDNMEVSISGLDLSKLGRQVVTYTVKDQVGNAATAKQDVYVVSEAGMLIFANDVLISGSSGESALFDTNHLTFSIAKYNIMEIGGQDRVNEEGTYDLLYYEGLYREGQMKYIAKKVTSKQLDNQQFKISFDKVGWYTIIVRNQEREREFAAFFIGQKN